MTDMGEGRLPAGTTPGRVALTVGDLDRVTAFYRDVVGLMIIDEGDGRVVLGADGEPLLVCLGSADAGPRPESGAGLFHAAFRVPSRAALGDALARVRDGWELTGASDHGVSEALYLRDPEGNGVEIYRDRDREAWPVAPDGRVEMGTEPLDLDAVAAAGDGEDAAPLGTDVGHVHLEVTDLVAARAFYADALGLSVRQADDAVAFMAAGDYHHHLAVNVWGGRSTPAGDGRGLAWYELVMPDSDALAAARDRLATHLGETEANARIEPLDEGRDGIAVADPDGIELRLRARSRIAD